MDKIKENIEKILKIFSTEVGKLGSLKNKAESKYVAIFIASITEQLNIKFEIQNNGELSFRYLWPRQERPEEFYLPSRLGGTDIVIDFEKKKIFYKEKRSNSTIYDYENISKCIGIEFKLISDLENIRPNVFERVHYFRTGLFSEEDSFYENQKVYTSNGTFIQHGHITYCKEGQFLFDLFKGLKILSVKNKNNFAYKNENFYCAGVFIYGDKCHFYNDYVECICKDHIKTNIKKLLEMLNKNSFFIIKHFDRNKDYKGEVNNITIDCSREQIIIDDVQINFKIKVCHSIYDKTGEQYNIFPYCIILTRSTNSG